VDFIFDCRQDISHSGVVFGEIFWASSFWDKKVMVEFWEWLRSWYWLVQIMVLGVALYLMKNFMSENFWELLTDPDYW